MKRREFVLSSLFMAAGWLLSKLGPFSQPETCLAVGLPMPSGDSPIPEKRSDIVKSLQNGRVLLKNGSHYRIILNDVGAIIWDNIDGKNTCNHISHLLSREFDINIERASKDVNSFVSSLKKEGFLNICKIGRCHAIKKIVCERKPVKGE